MRIEYIWRRDRVIHALVLKPSENKKLGFGMVIHTYHFSVGQVASGDLTDDTDCCFDCQFSFNQNGGKSGGCYTHKGFQRLGLMSMLKRLHKTTIKDFDKKAFNKLLDIAKMYGVVLTRFGVYGEPVTLPLNIVGKLVKISKSHTGYSHQWHKALGYGKYFMASVSSMIEVAIANDLGYRCFIAYNNEEVKGATCPASKEFKGNKLTCTECGACDGGSKRRNNIKIKIH